MNRGGFVIVLVFSLLSAAFAAEMSEAVPETVPGVTPAPEAVSESTPPSSETAPEVSPETPSEPENPYLASIDALCQTTGLARLRKKKISPDTLEVRLWIYGRHPLRGIFLRRADNTWSARHIPDHNTSEPATVKPVALKPEWTETWNHLLKLGILTLPDDQTLSGKVAADNDTSYVVEVNDGGQYRIYAYDSPKKQPFPEAQQIIEIAAVMNGILGDP